MLNSEPVFHPDAALVEPVSLPHLMNRRVTLQRKIYSKNLPHLHLTRVCKYIVGERGHPSDDKGTCENVMLSWTWLAIWYRHGIRYNNERLPNKTYVSENTSGGNITRGKLFSFGAEAAEARRALRRSHQILFRYMTSAEQNCPRPWN